jgi:hypothetical protein
MARLSMSEDALAQGWRQTFDVQQVADQDRAFGGAEGRQPQIGVPVMVTPGRQLLDLPAAVLHLGTEDAQQQQRRAVGQGERSFQQVQRGWVSPVQILADEDEGVLLGRTFDQGQHRAEGEDLKSFAFYTPQPGLSLTVYR